MTFPNRTKPCHPQVTARHSAGMTLLEVMLALALTAVVLVTISMAIDMHLRMLDERRGSVERIQLVCAVLQLIAKDLRSVVQQNTTDFSALASMATEAMAGGQVPSELTGDSGDAGGDGGGGGGGGSMGGDGDADDVAMAAGTDMSGGSGTGTDSSGTSTTTEDIASTSTPPSVPGLYGNQYELLIDVSRIPRVDEMQRMTAADPTQPLQDIPSDVKTVAYYYYNPNSGTATGDFRDRAGNPQAGLVRRSLDRAVTVYASENTNVGSLQRKGEVIAPEVAGIEFQYYDGTEWLYEWDSEQQQGLPVAVRITVMLGDANATGRQAAVPGTGSLADTQMASDQVYSLVVRLPTAVPASSTDATSSSGMESVGL